MIARLLRWWPMAAAAIVMVLVAALALRTPHVVATAPPLPHAMHVTAGPLGDLAAEIAAPLLSTTRSNGPAPDPAAAPAVTAPVLTGIAGSGGRRVALLKTQAGETILAHDGDTVDGWRVVAIAARSVTLDDGKRRQEVKLTFGGTATPPTATPASDLPG